ncbi:MAG: c-type cytochrome domain-containing protein [bacterium]
MSISLLVVLINVLLTAIQVPDAPTYSDIKAIFENNCLYCHNGETAPKKLRLTSYEYILKGSENGAVVVAGNPQKSELIKRVTGESQPRMPLYGPPWLTEEEITLLKKWIAAGATDSKPAQKPRSGVAQERAGKKQQSRYLNFGDVKNIFKLRCAKCHMERGLKGTPPEGLVLSSYQAILLGGERVAVVPGKPAASELLRRIRGQARPQMPFDGPPFLSEGEIELIEKWIEQGARDLNGKPAEIPAGARVRLHGRLNKQWELDGLNLVMTQGVRLKKAPRVGDYVEVRGRLDADGNVIVERLRRR